jgi:hypothetical protein
MVSIAADDCDIARSLQKNIDLAEQDGAEFGDDLRLKCVEGYLSLAAPPETVGKLLIRLPWECLVPIEPFQLIVTGDHISISSHDAALTRGCVARMEAILELFNLAGKFAEHRRTSPWSLIASHPELLSYIAQRQGASDPVLNRLIACGDDKTLMLQTFLHTRAYDYKLDNANLDNGPTLQYPVLMPVLDLMNHHIYGARYRDVSDPVGRALTMSRSAPLAGNECFACYGPYDSFDTWLGYDFIDGRASFVCSVAMTIELPRLGTIRLGNFVRPRARSDLPDSLRDAWFYIPKLRGRKGNHLQVSALLIPGPQAPAALRRALQFLIAEMSPGHPRQRDLAMQAEEQILIANETHYRDLMAFLRSLCPDEPLHRPIVDNFVQICELQLARIEAYRICAEAGPIGESA